MSGSTSECRDGSNADAPRRIAYLDMDAFFTSEELLVHPSLKQLTVAVADRVAHARELEGIIRGLGGPQIKSLCSNTESDLLG